jgi:hypothetical protein
MSKLMKLPLLGLLLGLAAMSATPAGADACPRFQSGYHVVGGFSEHTFTVTFLGGERARITVRGDGSSDLDLLVYDENGILIGQDLGYSDSASVSWTPRWTGPFVVVVKNRGARANLYRIATN